jgi:hypothetical protein
MPYFSFHQASRYIPLLLARLASKILTTLWMPKEAFIWLIWLVPQLIILLCPYNTIVDLIMNMTPEQRKELGINKTTLWYIRKNLWEGKKVKLLRSMQKYYNVHIFVINYTYLKFLVFQA